MAMLTNSTSVESELSNLRVTTRDAMIYLERLSELIIAGHAIDQTKRIPDSLSRHWFSSCLKQVLDSEKNNKDAEL
jgi:hypothetical protein